MILLDYPGLEIRVLGSPFKLLLWSLRKSEAELNVSISTLKALAGLTKVCE